ncbi:GNAT family N-acetyltransferase [Actinomycetospora straminea]|uniref:GNAT family N-acetyltransferase n=1 Tax=Actinomycetospora straminea TaxID=663607 RepID=A0ABP9EAS1_9PSEU|nr:GNAT family N-acetyltransferase [Actinomycetospora straminea]MDD7936487.1 GNAT family N-acetyltransferase [Actinomycetospora straminea]
MGWRVTDDVEEFWAAAAGFLAAHRVACTIELTIADTLRRRGPEAYGGPSTLAWWDDGVGASAVLVHTPRHRPVVSAMPPGAAVAWAAQWPCPHRVLGPATTVAELAAAWDATWTPVLTERLHRLAGLRLPADPTPTRLAGDADRDLLWVWLGEFHHQATPQDPPPQRAALDVAIDESRVVVAVPDGGPVAYASTSPVVLGTARIGPVYTRPEHRGRGHGAAVTAAAAQRAQARGADEVLLFTDLDNPTSNALYARLGFVGLVDLVDADLVPTAPTARKNV